MNVGALCKRDPVTVREFDASRSPRSARGRSLSDNPEPSQLDFAWRMRNSVFIREMFCGGPS